MGLLGLLIGGWLLWLLLTGRMGRPTSGQLAALILAIAGAALAARGRPLIGGGMAVVGLAWLTRRPRPARTAPPLPETDARMREALDLLGLPRDADRNAVAEAHRRLIARTHPDAGGTEALARSINAARDYLLERMGRE